VNGRSSIRITIKPIPMKPETKPVKEQDKLLPKIPKEILDKKLLEKEKQVADKKIIKK
jgi:hypothetical protein